MLCNPATSTHPCYSEKAHRFFSRAHLPIAPKCNIQCNYCHRKYDCVNESRPGVTSKLLSPTQAFQRVATIASKRRDLSVVGVAGPGDALANPEKTFKTFRLIRRIFPDLVFCLSTNGLELVNHIDEIIAVGINHVTVTVNTMVPELAEQIYARVKIDGQQRADESAISEFLYRQQQGIKALIQAGIQVKVNSLLIPGINDAELSSLSKRLKLMGVVLHNIMPLIAKPEHGSLFGIQNRTTPTHEQLEAVRKSCGTVKQMAHCRQCRADAAGKLGDETIADDNLTTVGHEWMEADYGYEKRENWRRLVSHILVNQPLNTSSESEAGQPPISTGKIAVCSRGTGFADLELKAVREFYIYQLVNGTVTLLNVRKVEAKDKERFIARIMKSIDGCQAVLSHKIGHEMLKELETRGVTPISDLSDIPVEQAIMITASRLARDSGCGSEKTKHCADFMDVHAKVLEA